MQTQELFQISGNVKLNTKFSKLKHKMFLQLIKGKTKTQGFLHWDDSKPIFCLVSARNKQQTYVSTEF